MNNFPNSIEELLQAAVAFSKTLALTKRDPLPLPLTWYPYDILSSLCHLAPMLNGHFEAIANVLQTHPILDIGCADGDLSLFFASLGCGVTAIDNPPTNSNWMKGIRILSERLGLPIEILEMDVDARVTLSDESYGFVFLLGILYHLKSPYFILETLAQKARYCALSTRVAAETKSGVVIENEPLAYLLDECESNNDPTNYWTFSPTALVRLAKRTGWRVVSQSLLGCSEGSNPVDPDKDARMFLLLQSQRLSVPSKIRLLSGWTPVTDFKWAWTLKHFSFEAVILDSSKPTRFFLGFSLIDELVATSPLRLSCTVNGIAAHEMEFETAGAKIFDSALPVEVDPGKPLLFAFMVQHQYRNPLDPRDIGIIVPFSGAIHGLSEPMLFWMG